MLSVTGISKTPGVAIATAVYIDSVLGLAGLPSDVMKRGIHALRSGLPVSEHPEVVVVSDLLSIAAGIAIPGIRVVGIAAKADDNPPIPPTVPCLAGVEGLSSLNTNGVIVILDADSGVIHVDPDIETLLHYQQNSLADKVPIDLGSPGSDYAVCESGATVAVGAAVSSIAATDLAIAQGANSLHVHFPDTVTTEMNSTADVTSLDVIEELVAMAGGIPVVVYGIPTENMFEDFINSYAARGITFVESCSELRPLQLNELDQAILEGCESIIVPANDVAEAIAIVCARTRGK